MKKLILYLFLSTTVLLFFSCSDSDDPVDDSQEATYYFSFKADGKQIDYPYKKDSQINLTSTYGYDNTNQLYTIQVAGIEDIFETNLTNRMIIFLSNTTELTAGITYSNTEGSNTTTPDFQFNMAYYNNDGEMFIAALNTFPLWETSYVYFEEITDNSMKGTFSGKLLHYDSSSGQNVLVGEIEITEGKFYVPRY